MKKIGIYIGLIILLILMIVLIVVSKKSLDNVRIETYRVYTFEDKEELVETIKIKEGQLIELSKSSEYWSANDVKILEINQKNVKISREVVKYDANGKEYKELVMEDVEYDQLIRMDISERKSSWEVTAPKYNYYLKFVK